MDADIYKRMKRIEGHHWWFVARRRILTRVIESLDLPADSRILEVGCGSGGNLQMLSRFGKVSVLEPDPYSRDAALENPDIEVKDGTLPDNIPYAAGSFDLIAAFDVIEHVNQDHESLKNLRLYLKETGYLVVTVPAFPFLWSVHDEAHHHFRRYSRRQLVNNLTNVGLQVVHSSYFNFFLFPSIAAIRLVRKVLPTRRSDDAIEPPGFVNSLLATIFSWERSIVPKHSLPFGVSLVAIARR